MKFSSVEDCFTIDGKKIFLNSGEIHYFRIGKELWDQHLMMAAGAGLTTVSTYVPWAWHEPEESLFDLTGHTLPERDLQGWLERCAAYGLRCIVKPGPFILAEYRGAGLPDWFLEKYHDRVRMRNSRGEMVQSEGVSLFNPLYLEKVKEWYGMIMPFISRYTADNGGPVIMMQICNEIGVFSWLAHQADYGNGVRERFITYLKKRYHTVDEINALWGTGYSSFSQVELPPDGAQPYSSSADRSRDNEWHLFWRSYYAEYLKMLSAMARERGITVPLYHNLPGWIYGQGYEFPVNITMYEELYGSRSELIFGVDHIPEFVSYRNMHDDRIINDITSAMQPGRPLFAAELQCGSREYHVVPNPREMELFYKASLANGIRGWNYYMFSQGRNRRHKGYSGDTFYWYTPLTAGGEPSALYPLIKRMSSIIGTSGNILLEASRHAEICVLFYPPYYATELERPAGTGSGLQFVPSQIRRGAWFDGLLKALQVLNVDYDIVNLAGTTPLGLSRYRQVWLFATDEMDAGAQAAVVGYAAGGGECVIFPYLPDRDHAHRQCTVIRDALSITPSGADSTHSPLIDIPGLDDIKCANPQITYSEESLHDAEIIARTISGAPCGFRKRLGKGSVTHLGTWIGFDTEGHLPVYRALLESSGATLRRASAGNERITVRELFTDEGQAMLLVANYYNEEMSGTISYTHPEIGETVTLPWSGEEITWPPLYAMLTPVGLVIDEQLKLLHSTSDILDIETMGNRLLFTLHGDRDLPGELVLEGDGAEAVGEAECEGSPLTVIHDRGYAVINYSHRHGKEFVIEIRRR